MFGHDVKRTWKQVWCGLRFHGEMEARIITLSFPYNPGFSSRCLEHYCARCGHVLLRLRLPL